MPRRASQPSHHLTVWRVEGLRSLELQRAEQEAARRGPHCHAEFEIAVIERGAHRVRHRGAAHGAGAGSVVIIPPGDVHAHDALDDDGASRSFFPDFSALIDASSGAGSPRAWTPAFRDPVVDDSELAQRIAALHRLLERPGSSLARESLAVLAATSLVERHAVRRPSAARPARATGAVRVIRDVLHGRLDGNVSLGELCVLTGLAPYALVRTFAREVGMPPHAYHVQLRVNRAKTLLTRGEPAVRVAHATGFVDQSHFTRHFRRLLGVTPGAYAASVVP